MKKCLYDLATDKAKGFFAGIIKFFLFILSLIYGLIIRVLSFFLLLRPHRLNCKVISVGNITLGGTGKTVLVEYIAKFLKSKGHKVAILTRGYKRKIASCQSSVSNYEVMGDEPCMLSGKLGDIPVLVDADRIRAAEYAIKDYAADSVVLDDGFQQWKMRKDLEIITIDATNPFGNRHMIPRGILREPLSSLGRADIFILTKTNFITDVPRIRKILNRLNSGSMIFESVHKPIAFYDIAHPGEFFTADSLKEKTVALFCGIGDPDSFQRLIHGLGMEIDLFLKFEDHHDYTKEDLDRITGSCRDKNIDTVITTEKDAVRISGLQLGAYSLRLLALRIELEIKDEHKFYSRLLKLYSV